MDAFGRTHRYRDRRCQAGRVHEKEFCINSCSSLIAFRNPWFCYVRNSSTILYRMALPATENRSAGIYLNTPWRPIRLSLLRLSEVVGQLKDLSLRLRMGVTIDGLLNSVESEKRQMCFASHFFDFEAHVVQALGLLGALFQWRSGFNWRVQFGKLSAH